MASEAVETARTLLRGARFGVLSTLQLSHQPGWPMGSLAPFALTDRGAPLFAFSQLAEHTKNLLADPRASLFVQAATDAHGEAPGDPQALPRVSLLGTLRRAEEEAAPALQSRYLAAHPGAARLFALDFDLWVLEIAEARVIGGFGAAAWIRGQDLLF
jgi:putative heme iron utilization protein